MKTPELDAIAENIRVVQENQSIRQENIKALRDAGEDVTRYEMDYKNAQVRLDKWVRMLRERGYDV